MMVSVGLAKFVTTTLYPVRTPFMLDGGLHVTRRLVSEFGITLRFFTGPGTIEARK